MSGLDFLGLNIGPVEVRYMQYFLLTLTRCSVILYLVPFFGGEAWPGTAKAGLAVLMALMLTPIALTQDWPYPTEVIDFALLIAVELMIGFTLSLVFQMMVAALQTGGQVIGFQIGFAIVNVIDPQTGTQQSVIAQIIYLTVLLIMLSLNGHHWFIKALADSLTVIKPGTIALTPSIYEDIVRLSADIFKIAIKVIAPALAVMLAVKAAMGIVAKAVPQINIMIVSFPLTIAVGLFFFGLILTLIGSHAESMAQRGLGLYFNRFITQMGGG